MMTASILAAFLAAAAGPAGNAAASGAPASASPGDEKITLNLRDADLKNLLEKLATVIGVTPIIAPGVGGTVTMSVSAPIPEILRSLERDFQITIRVADGRMFVTKPSAPPQALDEDAADLRTRADSSLPRRPAAAIPKRFEGAVEFWSGTGPSVVYSLAAPAGAISIPGCPSGFLLFTTPGDRFDGLPGLILKGSSILPRQFEPALEEAVSAEVPGCAGPLFVRLRASNAGAVAPVPLTPFGEFRIEVRILEVGAEGETVLSEPRLQVAGGEAAAIQSGSARRSPAGLTLEQTVQAAFVVVEASEEFATVAVSSTVMRDMDPKDGGPPMKYRVAQGRDSARLAWGKSQRIVLSPTFGRGDSALVLDVVIERLPGKN